MDELLDLDGILDCLATGNGEMLAADTRIRVVDNGTGGSSGQNAGYGTTSATGMTVRTTVDLDAGQWWVDYLPDGGSTWLPAVSAMPLSTDFTGISTLRIAVEGDPTPWAAGDFVAVDSLKFTKLP